MISPASTHEGYALLTAPGPAAIAVIGAHGPAVATFLNKHLRLWRSAQPAGTGGAERGLSIGQVCRAELIDEVGTPLDDILLTVHRPPPDWHLRLHLHGNPFIVQQCRKLLENCGLREQPESDGWRMNFWSADDLLAAEAYALLPQMVTRRGAHWLLGQVERLREAVRELQRLPAGDQVRGVCREIAGRACIADWFSRPVRVALVGPPNVGKSTLVNALADQPVSVVSPVPGTTRDWVEVSGEADGFPAVWLDTAGLRPHAEAVEIAGMEQTERLMREADAVIAVLDITDTGATTHEFVRRYAELGVAAVALNKCDLGGSAARVRELLPGAWGRRAVEVSARQRVGIEQLCRVMLESLGRSDTLSELPAAFTARQVAVLLADEASDPKFVQSRLLHSPPG